MTRCNDGLERVDPIRSRLAGNGKLVRGAVLAFLLGVSQGCYVYPAISTVPVPGTRLRFELNDRGRVGLGGSLGPSAERLEAVLQADMDSAYSVKMVSVSYLNGQSNRWTGEPLVVSKDYLRNVTVREFSKSRTILTAAAVLGGAVLLIATRGLFGSGTVDTDPPNPNPPGGPSFR